MIYPLLLAAFTMLNMVIVHATPQQEMNDLTPIPEAQLEKVDFSVLCKGSSEATSAQEKFAIEFAFPTHAVAKKTQIQLNLIPPGQMSTRLYPRKYLLDQELPVRRIAPPTREFAVSNGFMIGATKVSFGQYLQVMDLEAKSKAEQWVLENNYPMVFEYYSQAEEFCDRLSDLEGVPRGTYRLPSHVEWEWAYRGGTKFYDFYTKNGVETFRERFPDLKLEDEYFDWWSSLTQNQTMKRLYPPASYDRLRKQYRDIFPCRTGIQNAYGLYGICDKWDMGSSEVANSRIVDRYYEPQKRTAEEHFHVSFLHLKQSSFTIYRGGRTDPHLGGSLYPQQHFTLRIVRQLPEHKAPLYLNQVLTIEELMEFRRTTD